MTNNVFSALASNAFSFLFKRDIEPSATFYYDLMCDGRTLEQEAALAEREHVNVTVWWSVRSYGTWLFTDATAAATVFDVNRRNGVECEWYRIRYDVSTHDWCEPSLCSF